MHAAVLEVLRLNMRANCRLDISNLPERCSNHVYCSNHYLRYLVSECLDDGLLHGKCMLQTMSHVMMYQVETQSHMPYHNSVSLLEFTEGYIHILCSLNSARALLEDLGCKRGTNGTSNPARYLTRVCVRNSSMLLSKSGSAKKPIMASSTCLVA